MKRIRLIPVLAGIIFLFQPMVMYLTSYPPGDCDDKAVHYFSSAYQNASVANRRNFDSMISSFMSGKKDESGWQRTDFRIKSTLNYPLANFLIGKLRFDQADFTQSVKIGLFLVTFISLLWVVLAGSKTPLGFWPTVLLINLIAFYSIKLHFLAPLVPRNMHPFIAYVPRGGIALLTLAPLLAFATRNYFLFGVSLILIPMWHVATGGLLLGGILAALILWKLAVKLKFRRLDKPNFYYRLFPISLLSFVMFRLLALGSGLDFVSKGLERITGIYVVAELPSRLSGIIYVLMILSLMSGFPLLFNYLKQKFFDLKPAANKINAAIVSIFILTVLFLNHLTEYVWVLRGNSGFFLPQCGETKILRLPQELSQLTFSDEPTFFVSLAEYLKRI